MGDFDALAQVRAETETYGRHSRANVKRRLRRGERYISDPMLFVRAYFEQHPTNRTGRQFCHEHGGVILHPRVTVAELRLAVTG